MPNQSVALADAQAVDRGRYLVEGLLQCFYCHSERDWSAPGGPIAGSPGAGRIYWTDGANALVAGNLTPDEETGIGAWADETLERAIRRGIGHDGRPLSSAMPFNYFRHLSAGDVAAVIFYLRSREPVRNALPPSSYSAKYLARLAERLPVEVEPADLSVSDEVERGRRLVRLSRCQGCHTAWEAPRNPGVFAGGNEVDLGQGPAGAGDRGAVFSSNLTPDPTGLSYDLQTFINFMRTGRSGTLDAAMPWTALRNLNDADLAAIYAFLQTLNPVSHYVSRLLEPTYCAVCGQDHGMGEMNEPYAPTPGLALQPAELLPFEGTYHSERWDWNVRILFIDGRLSARTWEGLEIEPEAPVLEVAVLSRTRLMIPEEGALDVEFDEDGTAVRLLTVDVEREVLERVGSD